jgi:NTP pyrophosphatase (non-canonical NTP hydrolase)
MNSRSLNEMQAELVEFLEVRGWVNGSVGALMMSLVGEMGELAESMNQGVSFDEIAMNSDLKKEIGFEMVDVLNYMMTIAAACEIDLETAFNEKMPLLAEKYPIGIDRKQARINQAEYRATGKNKLYRD